MTKILILSAGPTPEHDYAHLLAEKGYEVVSLHSIKQVIETKGKAGQCLLLLYADCLGAGGAATLKSLLQQSPGLNCIVLASQATAGVAVEAVEAGALDVLTQPFGNDELLAAVERGLAGCNTAQNVDEFRSELSSYFRYDDIIGMSAALKTTLSAINKVACVDATLLIQGESGSGKELVARTIHRRGRRRQGPFVAVNCGAIPHSLFEAEFFGYEKGAFTDARQSRAGHFEQAHTGTLMLDEVGELSPEIQVKLLRVIENREVVRLGRTRPTKVDVRIIAATNIDLLRAADENRFRKDLYWRLNVLQITVPNLRDRREDILYIVEHLGKRFSRELGLDIKSFSPECQRALVSHDWPGNVRELENVVCSSMVMSEGAVITVADLPLTVRDLAGEGEEDEYVSSSGLSLVEAVRVTVSKVEKRIIVSRLAELNSNRTATAVSLGISRKSLFNKMRTYDLMS
ncbi:MAG TPA: sigma-54 dependent transcriptional regulator [Pyrinomonadaceae bacterium]